MTLLSKPHSGRVRILRHEDGAAPAATALSYEPVTPNLRPGAGIDEQLRAAQAAGFDEGYQQGLAAGRQAATSAHSELLAQTCQALMEAAAATAGNRAAAVASAEREAVELAFELAESLLQRELSISRSRAVDALTRALALVPAGEDLVVRFNPDDAIDPEELQSLIPDSSVKVVHDPVVEPGGCVVEAGPCRIDAQIGTAMERARGVIDSLMGSVDR